MASGDRRKRLIDLSLEPSQEAAILRAIVLILLVCVLLLYPLALML